VAAAAERHGALRRALGVLPRGGTLPGPVWQRRHAFLTALLAGHVALLPLVGIAAGRGVWHSLAEGGVLIAAFAVLATASRLHHDVRSTSVAVGLITSSIVLVHFTGGYVEAHFHFFLALLLVSFYESWLPLLVAATITASHHLAGSLVAPEALFQHAEPWPWVALHAASVVGFLLVSVAYWRLNEELRLQRERALEHVVAQQHELRARTDDLTAANARLQELDRLKSDFVSVASHELRTPLTSVLGFASTLRHRWPELDEAERREFVGLIEEQGTRLARLVTDLLDLSRIEAGTTPVRPAHVGVRAAAEQAVAAVAADSPIAIRCDDALDVRVDPTHLDQMLVNYLSNALRYGAPPIEVEAVRTRGSVEIRVRDAGDGVAPDLVPRLFEKFVEGGSTDGRGTGLGLAIVHGLAELNGGSAWYEPGARGATFCLRLPAA